MNKKNKNGVEAPKKASSNKKPTKKDLELAIASFEDKQLRLKAEFDNFRKRKEAEVSSLLKYEGKNFILDFLSVLDNISRGIESYKDEESKKALGLVRDDFLKKLESNHVKPFGEVGESFDPELHEALTTTNNVKVEDDTIVEVYQSGYKYKDLIIRHAKVVVNKHG
ncbi:MAG: nucleotide exchange factor GrpE [Candidatus Marinimicrobia bacterium]|nr:nucleotide exchange factor GrpE [Candidatus Neomarinimicrobiota bacterium]